MNSAKENLQNQHIQLLILILITILLLLPFSNKAFHMDDPLFLSVAKQILKNPFDFYGFNYNWYGASQPMYFITQNPPLTSYYIAIVALARYLILDMKNLDTIEIIGIAAAGLIIALAILVIRFGHTRFPYEK